MLSLSISGKGKKVMALFRGAILWLMQPKIRSMPAVERNRSHRRRSAGNRSYYWRV